MAYTTSSKGDVFNLDSFPRRHLQFDKVPSLLGSLGLKTLDELVDNTLPNKIRVPKDIPLEINRMGVSSSWNDVGETLALEELKSLMKLNRSDIKSLLGQGFYGTITPPVILRNVLENPSWYTPYTPYQAEISQGRLESLLNFQTMVKDLTGMDVSNSSLLDEATSAAEAMTMAYNIARRKRHTFFVSNKCNPTTISLIQTRAEPFGIKIIVGDHNEFQFTEDVFGAIVQYPDTYGNVVSYESFIAKAHENNAVGIVSTDLLALTLLTPPGEFGADIVVGTNQRLGVPMGYGGPNAGFVATTLQYQRQLPGRIIGISKDVHGDQAFRMALQTREQHIRRDKATSNICTAQALLANVSAMYGVYHGPEGLKNIATSIHKKAASFAQVLMLIGHTIENPLFFDTIHVRLGRGITSKKAISACQAAGFNIRRVDDQSVSISFDETITEAQLQQLTRTFASMVADDLGSSAIKMLDYSHNLIEKSSFKRNSEYMTHPVFNSYHTEHELLRYMYRLEKKDIGLNTSMIPLGSCTMKLNATSEMIPITWNEVGGIHPYVPLDQVEGYRIMIKDLETWLSQLTGFDAISLQPNAGSQGEYAGLRVISAYHASRGESHRDICLIPVSAHGTNPASAAMSNMKVVPVNCLEDGSIDVEDLKVQIEKYKNNLAAIMITYPSTYGVFEDSIIEINDLIHKAGGQVYMDGANMNAQVGLTNPGFMGADVCHLNLHKTFCIPHGGGGPGMGPIGVKKHLEKFLPNHPVVKVGGDSSIGSISMAPWGSASILPITWMYIRMMGPTGLKQATQIAILNANYMVSQLQDDYKIFYRGKNGMVAHELILDCRPFKKTAGIEAEDIAKRLQDFGFHAPTMSFPIPNTLMIEPTESESKEEMDRLIDALKLIRAEIAEIEQGKMDKEDNPLKNAPHTAKSVLNDTWNHPYSREKAVYPAEWVKERKYWPTVGRINNAFGDRHLICCLGMEAYKEESV